MIQKIKFAALLAVVVLSTAGCAGLRKTRQMDRKSLLAENHVLGLNAILADDGYYNQAVLEFKLVRDLISRFGAIYQGYEPESPVKYLHGSGQEALSVYGVPIMNLFNYDEGDKSIAAQRARNLKDELDISPCQFPLPLKLSDLNSGFNFSHYMFSGESSVAMQAFGISDAEMSGKVLYLVTDYLQYKDCLCPGLPKIRYAVGLRSVLRIEEMSAKVDALSERSLANLSARVQLGEIRASFSLKTIGISGQGSRYSIPENTSFDVETYKNYQNAIDFVRNLENEEAQQTMGIDSVHFHPEIVPVLDDYRTNVGASYVHLFDQLTALKRTARKVQRSKPSNYQAKPEGDVEDTRPASDKLYDMRVETLERYMTMIELDIEKMQYVNDALYSFNRYADMLKKIENLQ